MGYHRAGFEVVGVDINPQPRYPFTFVQGDAIEFAKKHLHLFNAVHGSPPCHDHTHLKSLSGLDGTGHLLADTRSLFEASGKPYIIENTPGADMRRDAVLCGGMFGLRTYRHRLFESNVALSAPAHPKHVIRTATKQRRQRWADGWHVSVTGDVGVYVGPEALGIDWMSGDELSQAIPPAYTELLGRQLKEALGS